MAISQIGMLSGWYQNKTTNPNRKKILEKVSFDKALFYKELVKTLKWIPLSG